MKAWFRFFLLASIVLYLLLRFGSQVPLRYQHPVDRYANSLEREPAPSLSPAWVENPPALQDKVVAPKESVVRDGAWTSHMRSRILRGLHGPPGTQKSPNQLWAKRSVQVTNQYLTPGLFCLPGQPNYKIRVLQQPLASTTVSVAACLLFL
jgi:hypothetical protein